jgi:predicted dehydrogenase
MDKVKWLLVGAGDIAQKRVAPALTNAANTAIDAICSRTKEHAQALAEKHGVRAVFTDFETALSSSSADAVYLATPVGLHARHAIAALKAGKHVLVEKPLALNGEQAREIVQAAEASGKRAGCAYYRRCYPRFQHACKMLENGEFGRVVLVRLTYFGWFGPPADDPKRWRVVHAESGGGALADIGSHMLDLVIGLFGLPRTVFAQCANLVHEWDVEDTSSILMTLDNGAHVVASFGWNSKTWRHEMEIVGTEAKLCWYPFDTGPVIKTVGRNTEELAMPNAENVHQPLVEDFVEAVLTGREPVCPVAEAARTSFVLDAVYQSAREKRVVNL